MPGHDTITDETLMAFADGALDDAEADAVATAIGEDEALVARLETLARARRLARDAFSGIAAAPVPARLVAAVIAADSAAKPTLRAANAPSVPAWRIGAAVAAGLVAGVVLGPILAGLAGREPGHDLARVAALAVLPPHVEAALAQELSGGRIAAGEQRSFLLVASHRLGDGTFCRSFAIEGREPGAGLACNRDGRWQVDAFLRQAPERPGSGAFRPASGVDPLIEEALERNEAGAPLSAAQEAEARARGWRRN